MVGTGVDSGVIESEPGLVWALTVKVPVTATAEDGMYTSVRPVTWKHIGVPAVSFVTVPDGESFATRVSKMRVELVAKYVAPAVPSSK